MGSVRRWRIKSLLRPRKEWELQPETRSMLPIVTALHRLGSHPARLQGFSFSRSLVGRSQRTEAWTLLSLVANILAFGFEVDMVLES